MGEPESRPCDSVFETNYCDQRHTSFEVLSAVTQNQPLRVEIKEFKTGHYLGGKTALVGLVNAGPEGHAECPESEPANDDIQFSRSRMVSAPNCTRTWDQSRDCWSIFAFSRRKTSHFDPRLGRG